MNYPHLEKYQRHNKTQAINLGRRKTIERGKKHYLGNYLKPTLSSQKNNAIGTVLLVQ